LVIALERTQQHSIVVVLNETFLLSRATKPFSTPQKHHMLHLDVCQEIRNPKIPLILGLSPLCSAIIYP